MRIALSTRAVTASETGEVRSAIADDWTRWLDAAGMEPLLIPNGLADPERFLDSMVPDLIVLTGGGERGKSAARDRVEDVCIARARRGRSPLLGICRGLQVINQACGGALTNIGGHVARPHPVHVEPSLQRFYGFDVTVNSYHDLGIPRDALASELVVAATDADGNIEAACHRSLPIAGVMWHPERAGAPAGDLALLRALIEEGPFWLQPQSS